MSNPFRQLKARWRAWRTPKPYQYFALRERRKPTVLILLVLLFTAGAVLWLHPVNATPTHHLGEWVRLPANVTVAVDLLSVSATQFWWEEITGPDGRPTVGVTANLSLSSESRPELHTNVRVHSGQTVEYDHYLVDIGAVGGDTSGQYLVFQATPLSWLPSVLEITSR